MHSRVPLLTGLLALSLMACAPHNRDHAKLESPAAASQPTSQAAVAPVALALYVMSKCPYAVEAERAVEQVLERFGDRVTLSVDYIASQREDGSLASLHGPSELQGNKLQLCALHRFPQRKALRFINCLNRRFGDIPKNWEPCATSAKLDPEQLMACYGSEQGETLLRRSVQRAQRAGARGSPTILIAGKPHEGMRDALALSRALCASYAAGPKPAACAELPADPEVHLTVLSDKRCADCNAAELVRNLRLRFFSRLTVRELDYGEAEGKQLFQQLGLKHLPVLLFAADLEQHPIYAQLRRWVRPAGKHLRLAIPASFDPTAEICDNGRDDTGNGKTDCADPQCKSFNLCRPERPGQLDLFVMSQCPFAALAVAATKEVLDHFGSQVRLDVHYVASEKDGSISSMHGQPEVEEDMRQLCAKKHYRTGDRYLSYLRCRFADYRSSDWRRCATSGISAQVIERCVNREGHALLSQNLRLAQGLGISASPTWMANNRHMFNGIRAAQVQRAICKHNPKLKGCLTTLAPSAQPPVPASGSCR